MKNYMGFPSSGYISGREWKVKPVKMVSLHLDCLFILLLLFFRKTCFVAKRKMDSAWYHQVFTFNQNQMYTFHFHMLIRVIPIICLTVQFASGQGRVVLEEPPTVTKMMEDFVLHGKTHETIRAWRIQIITTDDRREMESARSRFISLYPDISAEWKHVTPYYQVRVGAYVDKNKMMPFLLELKKIFPAATPVYDQISKKTLVYQ